MKVFIWISTLFAITFLNVILGAAIGFRAGSLIIYLFWFWLAKKLCSLWDKNKIERDAVKKGQTPFEYIKNDVPNDILEHSESSRGSKEELVSYYKACVKEDKINKAQSYILLNEYMSLQGTPTITENVINEEDKIRFCRKCGEKLLSNSQFCSKCGTEIKIENEERQISFNEK